jgi:prepilin-type N-terminal cleavage/methylation domain-containing protein
MKMFRKDEGFTLVELMVVVLIIGILVAIAVPVFLNASANAAAKSCQANQRTFNGGVQTYYAQANVTTLTVGAGEALGGAKTGVLFGTTGVIKTVPQCPSNGDGVGHAAATAGAGGKYHVNSATVIDSDCGTTADTWFADTHTLL